jgi:hypothetical protein
VLENGVPQAIRHFSTQALTARAAGPSDVLKAQLIQTADIAVQDRRVFLIVLGRGACLPAKASTGCSTSCRNACCRRTWLR